MEKKQSWVIVIQKMCQAATEGMGEIAISKCLKKKSGCIRQYPAYTQNTILRGQVLPVRRFLGACG